MRARLIASRNRAVQPVLDRTVDGTGPAVRAEAARVQDLLGDRADCADELAASVGRALSVLADVVATLTTQVAVLADDTDRLGRRLDQATRPGGTSDR
jgi:hypothetical protein